MNAGRPDADTVALWRGFAIGLPLGVACWLAAFGTAWLL